MLLKRRTRAILSALTLMSCQINPAPEQADRDKGSSMIVAGPGELSFDRRYRLNITLPIPEQHLITILNRLQLPYHTCGDISLDVPLPKPFHSSADSVAGAVKCYYIVGAVDSARRVGERYRAFVDGSGHVIYLENAFSYTGS